MPDHYETLGLERDATPEAVKAAHRAAVRRHHPDAGGDPEAFRAAQSAYETLSDPARRQHYDATGDDGSGPDDTVGRVIKILEDAFSTAMSRAKASWRHTDLIAAATRALRDDIETGKKANRELYDETARLAGVKERLTTKDGKPNVLANILDAKIEAMARQRAQNDGLIADFEAAIAAAADYVYRVDPGPPPPAGPQTFKFSNIGDPLRW